MFKQYTIAGQQSYIITTDNDNLLSAYTYSTYNTNAALGYVGTDYYASGQTSNGFIEVVKCVLGANNGLACSRGSHPGDALAVQNGMFYFYNGGLPSGVKAAVLVTEPVAC